MDQFLQLPSQSQGTSQSNCSQLIIKELASMQQENERLSAYLKELKEQIFYLSLAQRVSNKKIKFLKQSQEMELNEKSKFTTEKSEQKLNQFTEITKNLFLKNHANNDPMDVEPQVSILNKIEKKKSQNIVFVKDLNIQTENAEDFQENNNLKEKIYQETRPNDQTLLHARRKIYRKKCFKSFLMLLTFKKQQQNLTKKDQGLTRRNW